MPATDGKTYLSMVVRGDNTWDLVCQKLSKPINQNTNYSFSNYLAKSDSLYSSTLDSNSRRNSTKIPIVKEGNLVNNALHTLLNSTNDNVHFNQAAKLQIWGAAISLAEWKRY